MTRMLSLIGALIGLGLSVPVAAAADRVGVVATFSILGDMVARVGGERIDLTVLVGPGGDAHVYSPTTADARKVSGAKVVFVNGLGFEGWLERLAKAAGTKAQIVEATRGIEAIEMAEGEDAQDGHDHAKQKHSHDHKHDHAHGHHHDGDDPHAWQSVANARVYVANIRDALIKADPNGRAVYESNAAAYTAELDSLDDEVRSEIAKVPESARTVITSHDAFGYFAQSYGLRFLAPQGVSTEAEASAKDVGRLISQIRAEKVRAIFVETISDSRLVRRIADETGAKLGGELYSDALSPADGPAATYIDLIRHNTRTIVQALGG